MNMRKSIQILVFIFIQMVLVFSATAQRNYLPITSIGGGYALTQVVDIPAITADYLGYQAKKFSVKIHSQVKNNTCINISQDYFVFQSKNLAIHLEGFYIIPNSNKSFELDHGMHKIKVNWKFKGAGLFLGISNKYGNERLGLYSSVAIGYSNYTYAYSTITTGYYPETQGYWPYTLKNEDYLSMSSASGLLNLGFYVRVSDIMIIPSTQLIMASDQEGFSGLIPIFSMNIQFLPKSDSSNLDEV